MCVTQDIEDDDVVSRLKQMGQCLIEHFDELPRCPSPSHRVGKVIQLDRQRDCDEIAFRIGLQIGQIVVERIALPFVAVPNEAPEGVIAGKPKDQQVWLKAGDKLVTSIEKLGDLAFTLT